MAPCTQTKRRGTLRRAVLAALFLTAIPASLNGCYLTHVATGQLRLVNDSVDIKEALSSDAVSDADKARLRYVQRVRVYAERDIGLKSSDNYTTYYPGPKQPVTYVVTASRKDRLEPVTWWFPIVGSVSYKGFFDLDKAVREAQSLAADGYDVYLRPAIAYSTLGWFRDPILPLMLDLDDGELAMLIIHELTHGTFYAAGQTEFNESLAEFVGREGAVELLVRQYGHDDRRVAALRDSISDSQLYDAFMRDAALRIEALYAQPPADLEAARADFFSKMRADFLEYRGRFRTEDYRQAELRTLNNAMLVGHLAYADTAPFERAFEHAGRDWKTFFALIKEAGQNDRPAEKLEELIRQ